MFTFCTPTCNV